MYKNGNQMLLNIKILTNRKIILLVRLTSALNGKATVTWDRMRHYMKPGSNILLKMQAQALTVSRCKQKL